MKDKNINVSRIKYARLEAYLGAFLSNFFAFFIIVATAATLFVHKIPLTSGTQAALAIRPFAGDFAGTLFALGLVNAAIIGMIIVSLSSAYAFAEFFGFSGSLDEPYRRSRTFYTIFLGNLILSGILVVTPWVSLFKIVLYTQSLNGILLPVFFYYILKIINDKELMGEHTNSKVYNYISVIASVLIVCASIFAVVTSLINII